MNGRPGQREELLAGGRATEIGPSLGGARGRRILVVEDSPSAQRLLHDLLIRLGVAPSDLRVASSVAEAQGVFASWAPEIAIIDLQLAASPVAAPVAAPSPRETDRSPSGAQLAVELLERDPELRVIICSASDTQGTMLDPLVRDGSVLSLVKPLLASTVAETLSRAR